MNEIGISDIKRLIQLVQEKFGYDFSNYAISSFTRRVERILQLHKIGMDELMRRIAAGSFTKEHFLQEITVNVTEMFRDPGFWRIIKNAVEETIKKRNKIKIWHAGCASGEEVYSMLILLKELNMADHAEIVASDIDVGILDKARNGKISKKYFDINKNNYHSFSGSKSLEKYFCEDRDYFNFDKELLELVQFREIDLVKQVPFSKFDLVLCRNVLIYFNSQLQNEVLTLFSNSIFSGGYLAIGSKEAISFCHSAKDFETLSLEEKVFVKAKPSL